MSLREEQNGKFFMGGLSENYKLTPENPFTKDLENLKDEKAAKEARDLLLELQKKKQQELDNKLATLEMLPLGNKVILLPYPVNPYKKVMQGSIIVDYSGQFNNPDTGEKDKMEPLVSCAKVIEVGSECQFLKPDDDVYYLPNTAYPIPFMSLGYKLTSEPQILCVLNEGLKERFKMNE